LAFVAVNTLAPIIAWSPSGMSGALWHEALSQPPRKHFDTTHFAQCKDIFS
jgi:hypothetical protein